MTVDQLIEALAEIKARNGGALPVKYPDFERGGHEEIDFVLEVDPSGSPDMSKPDWVKVY